MDRFVQAYEQMAVEVEHVVSQYPAEMRDELRDHALEVMRQRLQDLWGEQQRRRSRAILS